MIGQTKLLKIIEQQTDLDEFPRFSIIVGPEGSGKKTLTLSLAYVLDCQRVFIEPKVDAVREMISMAYKVQTPTLYVLLDGNLSPSAKNALLKTLKSRAGIYYMQPYTPQQILEYANTSKDMEQHIIRELCEVPGDVDKLKFSGIEKFYQFVEKVVDNIASVSSANALKIADSIDTKGTDVDKYDLLLFLRAFKAICGSRMKKAVAENDIEGQMWYSSGIKVVSSTLSQVQVTGINKGALLDIFILNIRREWA